MVDDLSERPAMLELHRTYGKTIHTWYVPTAFAGFKSQPKTTAGNMTNTPTYLLVRRNS